MKDNIQNIYKKLPKKFIKDLMNKFEPWGYYEDKKGNNCFRVAGIDEIEAKEGQFVLGLHCFKVGSGQVDELIGVHPDTLVRVNGWKRHQISLISQCKIPEAFIRPLGYLLLQEMAKIDAIKVLDGTKTSSPISKIFSSIIDLKINEIRKFINRNKMVEYNDNVMDKKYSHILMN